MHSRTASVAKERFIPVALALGLGTFLVLFDVTAVDGDSDTSTTSLQVDLLGSTNVTSALALSATPQLATTTINATLAGTGGLTLSVSVAVAGAGAAVTNLLRLLDLPAEVTTMIESRAISMGHARALLSLEDEAERVRFAQMIATRQWSVRETESQVRKATQVRSGRAPAVPLLEVISEVMRAPGMRVELHQRANGTGKIVIEFDDAQTRDALLERLGSLER